MKLKVFLIGRLTETKRNTQVKMFKRYESALGEFYIDVINPMKFCKKGYSKTRVLMLCVYNLLKSDDVVVMNNYKDCNIAKFLRFVAFVTRKGLVHLS